MTESIEFELFNKIVFNAVEEANKSKCLSKRGAAIFTYDTLDGYRGLYYGYNHLLNQECGNDIKCKATCAKRAIHAEQEVLIKNSFDWHPEKHMLHVKSVNGQLVASGQPSCLECSKLILCSEIKYMWLYHEDGWKKYSSLDFHQRTLEYHSLA